MIEELTGFEFGIISDLKKVMISSSDGRMVEAFPFAEKEVLFSDLSVSYGSSLPFVAGKGSDPVALSSG